LKEAFPALHGRVSMHWNLVSQNLHCFLKSGFNDLSDEPI